MGADGPALTTPSRVLHVSTSRASAFAARRPRRPRLRSADSEMFSPTVNSAITASVCRSAGTSGMLELGGLSDVVPLGGHRRQPDLAAGMVIGLACEHVRELERAGAGQARDAEDLARARLEVDAAQPLAVDPASLDRHAVGPTWATTPARKSGSTSSPTILPARARESRVSTS